MFIIIIIIPHKVHVQCTVINVNFPVVVCKKEAMFSCSFQVTNKHWFHFKDQDVYYGAVSVLSSKTSFRVQEDILYFALFMSTAHNQTTLEFILFSGEERKKRKLLQTVLILRGEEFTPGSPCACLSGSATPHNLFYFSARSGLAPHIASLWSISSDPLRATMLQLSQIQPCIWISSVPPNSLHSFAWEQKK